MKGRGVRGKGSQWEWWGIMMDRTVLAEAFLSTVTTLPFPLAAFPLTPLPYIALLTGCLVCFPFYIPIQPIHSLVTFLLHPPKCLTVEHTGVSHNGPSITAIPFDQHFLSLFFLLSLIVGGLLFFSSLPHYILLTSSYLTFPLNTPYLLSLLHLAFGSSMCPP
jgi:hypothetical protein